MILYHYTCSHSAAKIDKTWTLLAHPHSMLPQAPPFVWLTDLLIEGEPAEVERRALGMPLDPNAIGQGCDRFGWRAAVFAPDPLGRRWAKWARRNLPAAQVTAVESNVPGTLPAHWWFSFQTPLPVFALGPTSVLLAHTPKVEKERG